MLREVKAVVSEQVKEGRLEWQRNSGVVEWYLNDTSGIEQGFELETPPVRQPVM